MQLERLRALEIDEPRTLGLSVLLCGERELRETRSPNGRRGRPVFCRSSRPLHATSAPAFPLQTQLC